MKYTWLLFDADGTLFDYETAEATALQNTFQDIQHPFEAAYLAMYSEINDRIWREFELCKISSARLRTKRFEELFAAIGCQTDPQDFSVRYLDHLAQSAQLLDGAEEVVRRLSESAKLLLITNGLTAVQRSRFAKCSIKSYFLGMVISEEVGSAKPDPGIFDEAFAQMGTPDKAEVLMIGDSLTSDMQGGRDYGLDTCWYNPTRKSGNPALGISYEIADLRELTGIVE